LLAVSIEPSRAVPETPGRPVFEGGDPAAEAEPTTPPARRS